MTAVEICLCILLVAGAFACICLGILFIRMLSTLDEANSSLREMNRAIDKANHTIDDLNYKLKLMNAPIEKVSGLFAHKSNSSFLGRTLSMAGAYRAGKKRKK